MEDETDLNEGNAANAGVVTGRQMKVNRLSGEDCRCRELPCVLPPCPDICSFCPKKRSHLFRRSFSKNHRNSVAQIENQSNANNLI